MGLHVYQWQKNGRGWLTHDQTIQLRPTSANPCRHRPQPALRQQHQPKPIQLRPNGPVRVLPSLQPIQRQLHQMHLLARRTAMHRWRDV